MYGDQSLNVWDDFSAESVYAATIASFWRRIVGFRWVSNQNCQGHIHITSQDSKLGETTGSMNKKFYNAGRSYETCRYKIYVEMYKVLRECFKMFQIWKCNILKKPCDSVSYSQNGAHCGCFSCLHFKGWSERDFFFAIYTCSAM